MKTLTALGRSVAFEASDGRSIGVRGSMLYDPSGEAWPKCSILIAPFERKGFRVKRRTVPRFSGKWLGWQPLEGTATVPTRDLSPWKEIAQVRLVFYVRSGEDDREFEHTFGTMGGMLGRLVPVSFEKDRPVLYSLGDVHRLELGAGCIITDAGIVTP